MKRSQLWVVIFAIISLIAAWLWFTHNYANESATGVKTHSSTTTQKTQKSIQEKEAATANPDLAKKSVSNIPQTVYQIHKYILQFNSAPPGHVGGRIFQNREKQLPQTDQTGVKIMYREWDVKAKKKGVNRGAERLVTGSDGSAYYTRDHYKTFIPL